MRARLKPDGVRTEMPREGRKGTERCGGGGVKTNPTPAHQGPQRHWLKWELLLLGSSNSESKAFPGKTEKRICCCSWCMHTHADARSRKSNRNLPIPVWKRLSFPQLLTATPASLQLVCACKLPGDRAESSEVMLQGQFLELFPCFVMQSHVALIYTSLHIFFPVLVYSSFPFFFRLSLLPSFISSHLSFLFLS